MWFDIFLGELLSQKFPLPVAFNVSVIASKLARQSPNAATPFSSLDRPLGALGNVPPKNLNNYLFRLYQYSLFVN